ncbi:MAG TPA: hypothetical protein VN493_10475 [Thermoanaerobaculia bacterium]|nr:hypothetical protein [Thermoanaerobaculia bacterium]
MAFRVSDLLVDICADCPNPSKPGCPKPSKANCPSPSKTNRAPAAVDGLPELRHQLRQTLSGVPPIS